MDDARHRAMELAFQWRRDVWLVIDVLQHGFRCFVGGHEEYLRSEPLRYFLVEIVHPDGSREEVA